MIPWDFRYVRPETPAEAVAAFSAAAEAGEEAVYLNGGTETVAFARQGRIKPAVVIELRRLPACRMLGEEDDYLVYGAALTLNEVIAAARFPLLERAARIVDHTVRNQLSLGGNLAGRLPYREVVLPFLLTDSLVTLYGTGGERRVPLAAVFARRLQLQPGEILIDIRVPRAQTERPWHYVRRTKTGSRVDYPLVTACFQRVGTAVQVATTGAWGFPLRSAELEAVLNDGQLPLSERPAQAVAAVPFKILEDKRAAADYRRFLLQQALAEGLAQLDIA